MQDLLAPPTDRTISRIRSFWLDHPIETGVPIIDLQHIYFLYTLTELIDLTAGKLEYSQELALKAFSRIIEYASEHFYTETIMLKRLNFPGTDGHLESHNVFIEYLKHKTHERISTDPSTAKDLAKYLVTWLFNHILKEDMSYVQYFATRGNLLEEFGKALTSRGDIFVSAFQMDLYRKVTGREIYLQVCDNDLIHAIHHMWISFDLSLQIPLLDMQHLWFIQMLLRMDRESRLSTRESRQTVLNEGMARIQEYAMVHFSTEEKLMERFGYPGLKVHRRQHHSFANSMRVKANEIQEHGADLAQFMDSTRKMKDWLLSHIAVQDKSLLWFLRKNRPGVLHISKELIRSGEAGLKRKQITLYRRISEIGISEGLTVS